MSMNDPHGFSRDSIFRDAKTSYLASCEEKPAISGWHIDFCRRHAGHRVLDLGCATGEYAIALKRLGFDCVGADVNERYIEAARKKGLEAHLTGDRLPFPDKSFDTVILIEVLEHVADPDIILSEVRRVARKNALISVPDCTGLELLRHYSLTYEHFLETDHRQFFTRESLTCLLRKYADNVEVGQIGPILPWLFDKSTLPKKVAVAIMDRALGLGWRLGLIRPACYSSLYAIMDLTSPAGVSVGAVAETRPDISVIIVSWNVRDYLKACLASIERCTRDVTFEVFVVDNNSADGSADMVKKEFPRVRLIENNENAGFAKANNQALKFCAGRNILFLNPDTELLDNAFSQMVDFMKTHPDAAAMGPKLLNTDGSLQRSCRSFPSFFTDLMENLYLSEFFSAHSFFGYYRMSSCGFDRLVEVDQPAGAALLVRRDLLDAAGEMDERYFVFFEEVDLCYRIRASGRKIFYEPSIRVTHHANRSIAQDWRASFRYYNYSQFLFFRKHYGAWSLSLLAATLAARTCLELCILPLTSLVFRKPRDTDLKGHRARLSIMWREYLRAVTRR